MKLEIKEHIIKFKENLSEHITYKMLANIFGVPLIDIVNLYNLNSWKIPDKNTNLTIIYNGGKIIYTELDEYIYSYRIYQYSDDWTYGFKFLYEIEIDLRMTRSIYVETSENSGGGFFIEAFQIIKINDNTIDIYIPELMMILR